MKYLLTLIISSLFLIIAPACIVAQPVPRPVPQNHHVKPLPPPPPPQKHHKRLPPPRVKYGEYCYYVPVPTPHYECESYHIRRDYAPVPPPPLKYRHVRPLPPPPPRR